MNAQATAQVATAGPVLPGEAVVQYVPGAVIQAALGGCTYVVPSVPLTGSDLVRHASRFPLEFPTKSDLVAASGHVKAGGKVNFISFYETLLQAKLEADPNYYVTVDNANDEDLEYDSLSHSLQALYDAVHAKFGEKWNHSEIMEFLQLLQDDIGINTAEQLEDIFYSVVDNDWNWEAAFAEEYVDSLEYGLSDSMAYSAIDWQKVWDHNLTYSFATIEFDGSMFLFSV